MISKKELQYYSFLLTKKFRKAEIKFIVEGKKSVLEGLNSSYKCEVIFITNKFLEENKEIVEEISTSKQKMITLKQKEFEKVSDTKTPQGIAAVFIRPKLNSAKLSLINDQLVVMLDNISDPGNLGTIIRNCDWFGIKNILLSENIADFTNPKVIRASMGSVFHVNIYEEVNAESLLRFKENGFEILCADTEGENIFTYNCKKKKILILSSESHGPSKEFEMLSDKKICAPKIGNAESLNVASASAVLLAILTK
ncbi:MAG: RNA methyltransferase [Ignavibacteriaceae bacterium]|jgi:TrmH family RNA methyltransferase|nr:RNA methyltransferase [Ignavibacteriaceae bacterium]MCW8812568.1 RNA methyltransferase [Chlorobium sp.]MCW8994905.1 RNA methyltransferase [Psychromonas sp.]MCW8817034.1 RNA methyltransferase [Ignavibacteriaceae bacterium]MCW8961443.1 RNA methyltransferase [Ignavibacteriaceae bacterium]